MQVPGVQSRSSEPSSQAWGAGFVHALRRVLSVSPTPAAGPASGTAGPARTPQAARGEAPAPTPQPRSATLWERFLGLVGEALRGALDFLRSAVDTALRALGAR
jgi:hypothetical protein